MPAIGGRETFITACRGRPAVLDAYPGCADTASMTREVAIGAIRLSIDRPRIVAAGGQAELYALAAADGADLVELRADLFDNPHPATVVAALERLRAAGRPVLLTVRAAAEGGRRPAEAARRE